MNLKIDEVTKNMNQLGFDVVFYGVDSKADADASFVGLPGCSAFTSPVKAGKYMMVLVEREPQQEPEEK
jgi:hypothetical protein